MTILKKEIIINALWCRAFELEVARAINRKEITIPTYLSVGTEHVAAFFATYNKTWPLFAQHRCHSYWITRHVPYIEGLIYELLGSEQGCNGGFGGSASISSREGGIFGHSGLLGDQVPIGVGYAFATKKNTLIILGDAAAEEDYVLGSLGFIATHNVPVLLICEDNDLSILTPKATRRKWSIVDVAKGFGLDAIDVTEKQSGDIDTFVDYMTKTLQTTPKNIKLINIEVCRHLWHAGSGSDGHPKYDPLKAYVNTGDFRTIQSMVAKIWDETVGRFKK